MAPKYRTAFQAPGEREAKLRQSRATRGVVLALLRDIGAFAFSPLGVAAGSCSALALAGVHLDAGIGVPSHGWGYHESSPSLFSQTLSSYLAAGSPTTHAICVPNVASGHEAKAVEEAVR